MMTGLFAAAIARQAARESSAAGAREAVSKVAREVRCQTEAIRLDVEKLFMITEAFWIILKDRHGYTDEQLAEMIREIDLRSGRLDGRRLKEANPDCPACGRKAIGKHSVCLYCGAEMFRGPFK